MALGTIRANKLRSALTVLGIVIGIMSIVGMTAILNGFSDSFESMIKEIGPEHDLRAALRDRQLRVRARTSGSC